MKKSISISERFLLWKNKKKKGYKSIHHHHHDHSFLPKSLHRRHSRKRSNHQHLSLNDRSSNVKIHRSLLKSSPCLPSLNMNPNNHPNLLYRLFRIFLLLLLRHHHHHRPYPILRVSLSQSSRLFLPPRRLHHHHHHHPLVLLFKDEIPLIHLLFQSQHKISILLSPHPHQHHHLDLSSTTNNARQRSTRMRYFSRNHRYYPLRQVSFLTPGIIFRMM